jgi:adenine specific DNA methylase Mod
METFEQLLYQLHLSYLHARNNKRNSHNQLRFEINQEAKLLQLAKDIYARKYTPKPCIAFIIHKPVMREIAVPILAFTHYSLLSTLSSPLRCLSGHTSDC